MKNTILLLAFFVLSLSGSFAQLSPWPDTQTPLFAAVTKSGNTGYIVKSDNGGHSWTTVWDGEMNAQSANNRLYDIASGGGKVVAVGNTILVSEDNGASWKEIQLFGKANQQFFTGKSGAMTGIAYGDGMFVAAGPFHIVFSTDGQTWKFFNTTQPAGDQYPDDALPGPKNPLTVEYIDGEFFVMGGNMNMQGAVFKQQDNGLIKVRDITFSGNGASLTAGGLKSLLYDGKNTLVALSNSTKSAYSTDKGKTWNYIFNPGKNQGSCGAYGNGKWIGASPFEDVFYMEDVAQGWQTKKRGGGRAPVNDMIYAKDRFIMVANNSSVLASPDGLNWEKISSGSFGMHYMAVSAYQD